MVRCALNAVLDVNLKNIDISRVQCMREVGKSVLESVTVGERELVAFDAFTEEIFNSCLTKAIMLQHFFAKLDKISPKIHLIPQGDKCTV